MKVMLIDFSKIQSLMLPNNKFGNYWVTDAFNNNLVNIKGKNGKWVLSSNSEVGIVQNNKFCEEIILEENKFYTLRSRIDNKNWVLYCCKAYDETFKQYTIKSKENFLINIGNDMKSATGDGIKNNVSFADPEIAYNQIQIKFQNNMWLITNFNENVPLYVNNYRIKSAYISNGDIIFIKGLKLCIFGNILLINNPNDAVIVDLNVFEAKTLPTHDFNLPEDENDLSLELFDKSEYYFRPPRFKVGIEPKVYQLDPPPSAEKIEQMPLIYTLGSMFTMGISSMVTGIFAVLKVVNGEQTLKDALPSVLVVFSMLVGMILIPIMSRNFTKKQKKNREKKRQTKYREYVDKIRQEINTETKKQRQILIDNNIPLKDCANIILHRTRNLWERKIEHDDFLNLRVGIGSCAPFIEIKAPQEHFTLDEDELRDIAFALVDESRQIEEVPITVNFAQKNISAVIGNYAITKPFMDGLILQMITYHSYDNLKLVIFTNSDKKKDWEKVKNIPYCWDNEKKTRYFGTNIDEISQISNILEEEFHKRKNQEKTDYRSYSPYYVIVTDDITLIRSVGIINEILKSSINYGFSIIINTSKLNLLPNECSSFINIDKTSGGVFENELVSNKKFSFVPDFPTFYLDPCLKKVSNIPIDIAEGQYILPKSISFLEMYNVGNVEQLNSFNRWKSNDPTATLQVPVGVNDNGELFKLDLHEKAHGPHGLVAGMTGSGKSEFIITYILSMAVNYHPNEVNFVLIDYKGGGLAGAFENKETGFKLPHLAGTITNLDVNDINRSLASLESELKRRQRIFNEARDALSESTIDIYKYQKLYREGLVKEPISHLFIISDEFAELKAQQPEFMDQLISTARIGRSLGVHLILATQKPSGVVDDQIWSNSKFRVCLKVQEKNDSMDMIKCADAASLKDVGRFYLQVGYNEYFALGQSAWCGAPYYETDKRKKKIDNSISFVDNLGYPIKTIENAKRNVGKLKGEELPNIMKYLIDIASTENVSVKKLWLDKIPSVIYVDNLKTKYKYSPQKFVINPVIGEYDVPSEQRQGLLTLPLTQEGNTLIYGIAGSGKDLILNTIVYSSISDHSPEELNIYIIDMGAETLRAYHKVPQVGDVILSSETEKISNLLRMIKDEIAIRKKKFQEYNGDYISYCKNSGKTAPTILVMINQVEVFQELYSEHDELITQLTRESSKYGIIFIFTASGINNVRYKLSQNFKYKLALQLNEKFDYNSVVGSVGSILPAKCKGRGLVNLGRVYEFQTAYVYKEDSLNEYIKKVSEALNTKYSTKAPKVPILPEIVDYDFVKASLKDLSSVPIGVEKETLAIKTFDFDKSASIIMAQDSNLINKFVESLAFEISRLETTKTFILDSDNVIPEKLGNCKVIKNSFDEMFKLLDLNMNKIIEAIEKDDKKSIEEFGKVVVIMYGLSNIKNILSNEGTTVFDGMFRKVNKTKGAFSIIIADSYEGLKKYEYDGWYKEVVNNLNGIWIGDGVAEQFSLKISKTSPSLYKEVPQKFGYAINNGVPTLIKVIESYESEEDIEVL